MAVTVNTTGDRVRGQAGSDPAATPATPEQAARRQQIVDVAGRLLVERPVEQIQMRDVAEQASVALGTLYRYFPSKDRLFGEVIVQWTATFDRRFTPGDAATPGERMSTLLSRALHAFARRPHYLGAVRVLDLSADPAVVDLVEQHRATFERAMQTALTGLDSDDAQAVGAIAAAVLDAALRGWAAGREPLDVLDGRFSALASLVFSGPVGR